MNGRLEWIEPGAHEVAPGVHRIPLPLPQDGLRAVNVYAIADGSSLTLVDAGWALEVAKEQLSASLASIGAGLGDIRRFLVTHVHRDHYTQAVTLRREFGGRVFLGEGERLALELAMNPVRPPLHEQMAQLISNGAKPVVDTLVATYGDHQHQTDEWEIPDEWIDRPTDVTLVERTLKAVPTPGHTRGHLVYVDEGHSLLFAGDHVLPHITPSVGFEPAPGGHPLRDFLDSLRLVRAMPDMRLLPAHGPVTDSAHDRVDELIAFHDVRLDETFAVIERDPGTGYDVARALGWTRRQRHLDELDVFNQMLAVMETVAHLDLLVLQGRLHREESDGVFVFSPR